MAMSSKEQLALQLRDEGMTRAADHSGDNWQAEAYHALLMFLQRTQHDFTAESVRDWATILVRVAEPPDRRAWGAVMMKAAKRGLIKRAGYRPHSDPSRHRGVSTVWRKA